MGLVGTVEKFDHTEQDDAKVSEVTVDTGGGANTSPLQYANTGDDSQPLPEDYAALVEVQGTGRAVVVGYLDTKNDQKAESGEKRIYARSADGASIVEIWLKKDGTARISNGNGYLELEEGGDVVANGAKMTTGGDVLTSEGISLRNHVHVGNLGVNTSPPVP